MTVRIAVLFALAVTVTSTGVSAAGSSVLLNCTSSRAKKAEAELKYVADQKIYTLNVAFIGRRPTKEMIDPLLRECLAEAMKRDSSKDILVTPWFRPRPQDNPNDDELLSPYGFLTNLVHEASTKKAILHKAELKRK